MHYLARTINRTLLVFSCACLLAGCADDVLTNPPPLRRTSTTDDLAASAIALNFDYFLPFSYEGSQYEYYYDWGLYSTYPKAYFHFVLRWSNPIFEDPTGVSDWAVMHRSMYSNSLAVGWVWPLVKSWITFPKPIKYISMSASPGGLPVTLRCTTRENQEVASTVPGSLETAYTSWGVLEVAGPGIEKCVIDGYYAFIKDVRIVVEPTQQAKLTLKCNPSPVRRGDSVACVASASPAGSVPSDLVWTFTDSIGHQIAGPTGSDTLWGGRMAIGGRMKVTGKVNGVQVGDSVSITVQPRTGWPTLRLNVQEKGHGDLPAPSAVTEIGQLAHTHVDAPAALAVDEIKDGPNYGWVVLDSVPVVPVTVHINDAWQHGSAWYNLQHYGTYVDPVTGGTGHYCAKYELSGLLPDVRGHEGSIAWSKTSHVDVFRDWVRNHRPQDQLEAAVVYAPDLSGTATVEDWYMAAFQDFVRTPMMSDPDQRHTTDSPPGRVDVPVFPCAFRFFP